MFFCALFVPLPILYEKIQHSDYWMYYFKHHTAFPSSSLLFYLIQRDSMTSNLVLVNVLSCVNEKKDLLLHLITLHDILEEIQSDIKTEPANSLESNNCVNPKTFDHDCMWKMNSKMQQF